jgi:hypothetical protein
MAVLTEPRTTTRTTLFVGIVAVAKTLSFLAAAFLFVVGGIFLMSLKVQVTNTASDVHLTMLAARSNMDNITDKIASMSADIHAHDADVTRFLKESNLAVKESQFLILQAGLTTGEVRKSAQKEYAILDDLNGRVNKTLDDFDHTVVTADHTVANLNPVFLQAGSLLVQGTTTLKTANTLLADPDIFSTLKNAQDITKSGAAIVEDGHVLADKYAHPPKKKLTFWGAIEAGAYEAHKFLPPLF